MRIVFICLACLLFASCATRQQAAVPSPYEATALLISPEAAKSSEMLFDNLYDARTWVPFKHLPEDPITLSSKTSAPINNVYSKILGTTHVDALNSLAAKIWLINHAEHTLDLTYYIFKPDLAGKAILGALCNAVKRGVDVRIMIDSIGSFSSSHTGIRALETCAEDAGLFHIAKGKKTKARVQFVIINALTSWDSWNNRRSHDKLIIKDGHFPGKDYVMTGGRNISLDYYGIDEEGWHNPNSYLDLEILLRAQTSSRQDEARTVGDVSSAYYTLLFLHKGNRRIYPLENNDDLSFYDGEEITAYDLYKGERLKLKKALEKLMGFASFKAAYDAMPEYMNSGFSNAKARLAHQLENLTSEDVIAKSDDIKSNNANSIEGLIRTWLSTQTKDSKLKGTFRIVSPYLFVPRYENSDGIVTHDGAKQLHDLLNKHPELNVEIITNSVLTSDNYFTQSVIDMDTAPRLLLEPPLLKKWIGSAEDSEDNKAFVESVAWRKAIQNPRIKIYQTGMKDSALLGGDKIYGKLHAKFFFSENIGFVGTSNFDYRSRLYNNEMGFYFSDKKTTDRLLEEFERLKSISLPWGTSEWLDMRKKLVQGGGGKGFTTKTQRARFNVMKFTGLIWLF